MDIVRAHQGRLGLGNRLLTLGWRGAGFSADPARRPLRRRAYQRLSKLLPHGVKWRVERGPQDIRFYPARSPGPAAARRVLLVSHDLSASGAPKVVVLMASAFAALGYAVTAVSPSDGPIRDQLLDAGAEVVIDRLALAPSDLTMALAKACDLAVCNTIVTARLAAAIAVDQPAVCYSHEISLLEATLANDPGFPAVIAAVHGFWAGSELSAALLRPLRPDVAVVPYGMAAISSRERSGRDPRARLAIFGSIERRKGQDLAAAAVAWLDANLRRALEIRIHGRTLEPHFAARLEADLAAVPEVVIAGELDLPAYNAAVAECDGVLVPSRDDTLPLVSLDALGAGKVLLCTRATGTSAYVEDGVSAFIAPEATAESIAAMLTRALAERDRWPAIGKAGQEVFAKAFSVEAFEARLAALAEAAAAQWRLRADSKKR